jgi:hypothetical protein
VEKGAGYWRKWPAGDGASFCLFGDNSRTPLNPIVQRKLVDAKIHEDAGLVLKKFIVLAGKANTHTHKHTHTGTKHAHTHAHARTLTVHAQTVHAAQTTNRDVSQSVAGKHSIKLRCQLEVLSQFAIPTADPCAR